MNQSPLRCSVGIIAYNEAANIGQLIEQILTQHLTKVSINEIIVVASGCTDGTEKIAQQWAEKDQRIRVLIQEKREGKASGINYFMEEATEEILVLSSADLQTAPNTVELLVAPFSDPDVGMTSCKPVPVNQPDQFMGFAAHLLWELHHHINLNGFKAGEMTAYRKIFKRIPFHTAVDEASVEPMIRGQGYLVRYIPESIVYNKGPETISDFLKQRRRIYSGHLVVRDELDYSVSTMSGLKIVPLVLKTMDWRPKQFVWTISVVALEVYGRLLGHLDYRAKIDNRAWDIAETTKELDSSSEQSSPSI